METFVAAGEQDAGDMVSLACPFGECAATEEFWVVGVGEYDEDVLRRVPGVSVCQVISSGYQFSAWNEA